MRTLLESVEKRIQDLTTPYTTLWCAFFRTDFGRLFCLSTYYTVDLLSPSPCLERLQTISPACLPQLNPAPLTPQTHGALPQTHALVPYAPMGLAYLVNLHWLDRMLVSQRRRKEEEEEETLAWCLQPACLPGRTFCSVLCDWNLLQTPVAVSYRFCHTPMHGWNFVPLRSTALTFPYAYHDCSIHGALVTVFTYYIPFLSPVFFPTFPSPFNLNSKHPTPTGGTSHSVLTYVERTPQLEEGEEEERRLERKVVGCLCSPSLPQSLCFYTHTHTCINWAVFSCLVLCLHSFLPSSQAVEWDPVSSPLSSPPLACLSACLPGL